MVTLKHLEEGNWRGDNQPGSKRNEQHLEIDGIHFYQRKQIGALPRPVYLRFVHPEYGAWNVPGDTDRHECYLNAIRMLTPGTEENGLLEDFICS